MKLKIFFGWYIVVAAFFLVTYNSGMIAYGFTAFIAPIAATFGWSYAQISLGTSIRGLEMGALDPLVGVAVDRYPAKWLILIGVNIYALGLVMVSLSTNLFMFYAGFVIVGLGSSLAVYVVPQATVARWFKKNVGKASAALALGPAVGGTMVPVLVMMIDTFSWQTSLLILAAGVWIIGIPLSFLFRTRPEDCGLLPDGQTAEAALAGRGSKVAVHDNSVSIGQALKMRAFWHIGITNMLQSGAIQATLTHVMPYLGSLGIDRATASMVAMAIPLVSLTARLPYGWLADIFPKRYVMAASATLTGAGLIFFWLIGSDSFGLIVAFVVVFAMGLAGSLTLRTPTVREYFGTRNFGTIYGVVSVFNMIGLLAYPPMAGWVYDTLGYYGPVWLVIAIGAIAGGAVIFAAPPPRAEPALPSGGRP